MPGRKTMNVSLTPELEAFVAGRVASGRFRSNSEVLRAAIRLLEEAERLHAPASLADRAPGAQLAPQPMAGQAAVKPSLARDRPIPPVTHDE